MTDPASIPMTDQRERRKLSWSTALLVASGLIPMLSLLRHEPDSLLIYSVFVVACLFRRQLAGLANHLPGPPAVYLILFFIVSGELAETFAWMGNYSKAIDNPALLHPQLIPDLILGIGLYTGWALAWLIVFRWYRFSLAEAFVITGLQAILFEQLGGVLLRMVAVLLTNPLLSLLMALYVFAVHASVVGLAMVPVIHRLVDPNRVQSASLQTGDFPNSWPLNAIRTVLSRACSM